MIKPNIFHSTTFIYMALLIGCTQKKDPESLYYFPNADTTYVGVKNGKGDTIIPVVHPVLSPAEIDNIYNNLKKSAHQSRIFYPNHPKIVPDGQYDFDKAITGLVIQFNGISKGSDADLTKPRIPAGEVYSRKGKFLYYAAGYLTDVNNTGYYFITPQLFTEGYRLYVENGKLGYVDGIGNEITPALWEFAEPFNYGYAKVYNGRWAQIPMLGHTDYRALTNTANIRYINNKGEYVKTTKRPQSKKDYYADVDTYLPYPFAYTAKEQKIIDSLNRIKAITYTSLVDAIRTENSKDRICFEITDRPKPGFPYYFVQGYWRELGDAHFTFLVHQDTKEIFHYGPQLFLADEKIPLAQWMADGLQKVKQNWETEAPGIKLKINIDKELEDWQNAQKGAKL
jgi:hypothetical protein